MNTISRFVAAALCTACCCLASVAASDWSGFRGPRGTGSADAKDAPAAWTTADLVWKVKLPGPGASCPITSGDKVFVTCYTGYGTKITKGMSGGFGGGGSGSGKGKGGFPKGKGGFGGPDSGGDPKKLRLVLLCLDQKGQILWQKEIAPRLPEAAFADFLRDHGYATNSPATDGERVYAFFGKTGVVAFDFDGKQLWTASVGTGTNKWGTAASPVLYKNLVIVCAGIEGRSLVALDKATGKEVWKTGGVGTTWGSPVLVELKDGKHEIALSLPDKIAGYDPETGKELWRCQGVSSTFSGVGGTYSTPVAKDGVVYVTGGGGPGGVATAVAVKAGGRGDVNKTHVVWRQKAGTSFNSPLIHGDHLYCIDGTVQCLRLDTGKMVYRDRLFDGRGEYPSPVAAGDKIFAVTRFDGLYVMTAGEKFQKLGHSEFAGDSSIFNASPAVSNGRLYVRSNEYLYCIGKKAE